MLNTSKLRKKQQQRKLAKLAVLADRLTNDGELLDKQDQLLSGLDDGWEWVRRAVIDLAGQDGNWAGYPIPSQYAELVIEPRHPLAHSLDGATLGDKKPPVEDDGEFTIANAWHDYNHGRTVYVIHDKSGRATSYVVPEYPSTQRVKMALDTLGASQAWGVEAEFTAMARLKTLITPTAFRYYLLTGTFLETSQRSGVTYLFRKGRPTIALKATLGRDDMKVLCALCLHPIGYYKGTYAGSMVPTDDVIAHLVLMRGDERKYWSKCNQHDCRAPEAGV